VARQRGVARYHRTAPRESAPRVPEHAIHSCTREGSNGLAGPSGRCGRFRGGSAARLRSRPGRGSSDRQGAGGAAGLWIGARKAPESLKGGEVPKSAAKGRAKSLIATGRKRNVHRVKRPCNREGRHQRKKRCPTSTIPCLCYSGVCHPPTSVVKRSAS